MQSEKTPLVRYTHKLKDSYNSSLAMPVQERSAKASRHSVMTFGHSGQALDSEFFAHQDTKARKTPLRLFLTRRSSYFLKVANSFLSLHIA